jgi:hypothetical protein
MPKKVVIRIEDINAYNKFRSKVNRPLLSSIIFTKNGVPIHLDKQNVEEFLFTGLSNIDFISSGFYKLEKLRGMVKDER